MKSLMLFLFFSNIFIFSKSRDAALKIAIIGSGIGGTSAAHYLINSTLVNAKVDLYEKDNRVGGRVYSKETMGRIRDVGARFFLKENELIFNMVNELSVPYEQVHDDLPFALFKNRTIEFQLGHNSIINIFKVIWRYGLAPLKAKWILKENFEKFKKVYDHLRNQSSTFETLEEFLDSINLKEFLTMTTEEYFLKKSVTKLFVDEMINSFIAGIYNQHHDINAFAGFVTLAGINYDAYLIKGGNNLLLRTIIENLNKSSERFKLFLETRINGVKKLENGKFRIKTDNKGEIDIDYDYVIIACPVNKVKINFEGFEIEEKNLKPTEFQPNHKTYVKGSISPDYFGVSKDHELDNFFSINKILSNNITEFIKVNSKNSTGGNSYYYILQGDYHISKEDFEKMGLFMDGFEIFDEYHWEFAYPRLMPVRNLFKNSLPSFQLHDNIYHINAMELAASCMEMSMISSKNIVKMIENKNIKVTKTNNNHDNSKIDF